MAECTVNSELSRSESKHDGQAMPEGHRWTDVRSDAEGGGMLGMRLASVAVWSPLCGAVEAFFSLVCLNLFVCGGVSLPSRFSVQSVQAQLYLCSCAPLHTSAPRGVSAVSLNL